MGLLEAISIELETGTGFGVFQNVACWILCSGRSGLEFLEKRCLETRIDLQCLWGIAICGRSCNRVRGIFLSGYLLTLLAGSFVRLALPLHGSV